MADAGTAFYPLHGRPLLLHPLSDAVGITIEGVMLTFMPGPAKALANAIAAFAEGADIANKLTSPPKGEVTDRPEPVITALQLLERVAAVIESAEVAETVEAARTRLAVLAELAHLANVAMGRAPIVPPKAAP